MALNALSDQVKNVRLELGEAYLKVDTLEHLFSFFSSPEEFPQEFRRLGAGVIVDSQGHVLTNHHLVYGTTKIHVVSAGMREGDVVAVYQGKVIDDARTLDDKIASTPIGQEVNVVALRNGKSLEFAAKISELERTRRLHDFYTKAHLGADIRFATAQRNLKDGMPLHGGVVIIWLDPDGPMAKAGFEVGDVILRIDGQPIKDVEEFTDLLASRRHDYRVTLLALDHRSGRKGYVQVALR